MKTTDTDALKGIQSLIDKRAALLEQVSAIDKQLAKAQQRIQSILSNGDHRTPTQPKAAGAGKGKAKAAMTVDDAILKALKDKPGSRVADLLPVVTKLRGVEAVRNTLQVQLQRLKGKGITTSDKGAWSLKKAH